MHKGIVAYCIEEQILVPLAESLLGRDTRASGESDLL